MSFKNDIPDYKSYPDGDLYMQTVPSGVWSSLGSLIRRASSDQYKLKAIINTITEITGGQLTQNYNWSFLEGDIPQCVRDIKKTEDGRVYRFKKFMLNSKRNFKWMKTLFGHVHIAIEFLPLSPSENARVAVES